MSSSKKKLKRSLEEEEEDSRSSDEVEVVTPSSSKGSQHAQRVGAHKAKTKKKQLQTARSSAGALSSPFSEESKSGGSMPTSTTQTIRMKRAWQVDQDKEEPLGRCIATMEVLGSEAWEATISNEELQEVESSIAASSLRQAASIKFGKIKFLRHKQTCNLWAAFVDQNGQFVAQLVLFGVCWRVEGLAENRALVSKQDGIQTIRFDLKEAEVFKEYQTRPGESKTRWRRVAASNLGITVEPTIPVIVQYQISNTGSPVKG